VIRLARRLDRRRGVLQASGEDELHRVLARHVDRGHRAFRHEQGVAAELVAHRQVHGDFVRARDPGQVGEVGARDEA